MEKIIIILTLVAAIMAIQTDRLKYIGAFFPCCITSFYTLKLFYPNIWIWHFSDYDNNNNWDELFFGSWFFISCSISLVINYVLIYRILKHGIIFFLEKRLRNFYDKKNNSFQFDKNRILTAIFIRLSKRGFRFLKRIGIKEEKHEEITYINFRDSFVALIIVLIHIAICCYLLKVKTVIFVSIIITLFIFITLMLFLVIPISRYFMSIFKMSYTHEYSRD